MFILHSKILIPTSLIIGLLVTNSEMKATDKEEAKSGCFACFKSRMKITSDFVTTEGVKAGLIVLNDVIDDLSNDSKIKGNPKSMAALTGTKAGIELLQEAFDAIGRVKSKEGLEEKHELMAQEAIEFGKKVTTKIELLTEMKSDDLNASIKFLNSMLLISKKIVEAPEENRMAMVLAQTFSLYKTIKSLVNDIEAGKSKKGGANLIVARNQVTQLRTDLQSEVFENKGWGSAKELHTELIKEEKTF